MKGSIRQRLIQGGVAVATSAIMLSAFVGLSAAAPGGHGQSGESHGHAAVSNSGGGQGHDGDHGSGGDHGRGHDGDGRPTLAAVNGGQAGDNDDNDERPGFGCGDRNHIHTGPPGGGPSFNPCTFHVITTTQTLVSGTVTQTITTTETVSGTVTETATETATSTTTSAT